MWIGWRFLYLSLSLHLAPAFVCSFFLHLCECVSLLSVVAVNACRLRIPPPIPLFPAAALSCLGCVFVGAALCSVVAVAVGVRVWGSSLEGGAACVREGVGGGVVVMHFQAVLTGLS